MRPMPYFETDVSGVSFCGDIKLCVPRSTASVGIAWSIDGIKLHIDRDDTAVYIKENGISLNTRMQSGFTYKWPEPQSERNLSLSIAPEAEPFAQIHIWFISDMKKWDEAKKKIKNSGDCFRMEFSDIESDIVDSVLHGENAEAAFENMMKRINDVKSMCRDGVLSKSERDKILQRWDKLAYQLAVSVLSSDSSTDSITRSAREYVKSYLKLKNI